MKKTLIKAARKELLAVANCYEPIRRKFLKGIFFDSKTDCFCWIGHAHNYSIHKSNLIRNYRFEDVP